MLNLDLQIVDAVEDKSQAVATQLDERRQIGTRISLYKLFKKLINAAYCFKKAEKSYIFTDI